MERRKRWVPSCLIFLPDAVLALAFEDSKIVKVVCYRGACTCRNMMLAKVLFVSIVTSSHLRENTTTNPTRPIIIIF